LEAKGKVLAIVAAGGIGKRMGKHTPKQFLPINNKPILIHTLQRLDNCPSIHEVILAVSNDYMAHARELLKAWQIRKVKQVIPGGKERQDTIYNALQRTGSDVSIVLIHDAVRPFVSVKKIEEVIRAAESEGAAILAVREKCTVKRAIGHMVSETVERSNLWQIQTPQAFRTEWLKNAYEQSRKEGILSTDDSMLVERTGRPVMIIEGEDWNIKITTQDDLILAEAMLDRLQKQNVNRSGN
jgi:2-C-methyl-D-erythritol 4-phosphate cytidylyltransferase